MDDERCLTCAHELDDHELEGPCGVPGCDCTLFRGFEIGDDEDESGFGDDRAELNFEHD